MRYIKTYLSVAPMLTTLWFGSLAGLLIEINRIFPDAHSLFFFRIGKKEKEEKWIEPA